MLYVMYIIYSWYVPSRLRETAGQFSTASFFHRIHGSAVTTAESCRRVIDCFGTFAQALAVIRQKSFAIDEAESQLESVLLQFHQAALLAWGRDKQLMTANFASMWQLVQSRAWLGAATYSGSTMTGERSHLTAKQVSCCIL
jgi:hypothetical protein